MTNILKESNSLMTLCSPVFCMLMVFFSEDHGAGLPDDYGEQLKKALDTLEHRAFASQTPAFEIQQIKYALAALIDELVLNSAWNVRKKWMGEPLQLVYFGEHIAGEGFFKRLIELRQAGARYLNVLEIYFLCLQLGFEGMYCIQGLEKLLALQTNLRSQIEMLRGTIDPKLVTYKLKQQSLTTQVGRKLPVWISASITATIIFFIYLGYAVAIDKSAKNNLKNIKQIEKTLSSQARRN